MSINQGLRRVTSAAVVFAAAMALAACGKQGVLEQPAPLFGSKAKAEYEARKAQEAKDDAQRAAQRGAPGTTQTGNDNTPVSTRDILDPAQRLSPASSSPLPGAPNPMGAPIQTPSLMEGFTTRGGELWCEDVRLTDIAKSVGAPAYVYSTAVLEARYRAYDAAFDGEALIAYAVKANANLSVLKTLFALGAGADTVSQGEIRRALAAGAPADRIVFSGVGKTSAEIAFALKAGVAEINVEAEPELRRVAEAAASLGVRAPVAFRVNPDVAAGGHAKIATGKKDNKFGVSFPEAKALYGRAANDANLNPVGVACHIGSQITELAPFEAAFMRMRGLVEDLRAEGLSVERLDLGGGLGVDYFDGAPAPPTPADYAAMVRRATQGLNVKLAFEPGRSIVANAGVLLTEVIHVYERPAGKRFLVVDAAMNDLIRPAMYDAFHAIRAVKPREGAERAYDVVGPVCETGDTFAKDRALPPFAAGDLVAFLSAGAYGAVMASEYNTRPLVPEVLVRGERFSVVRARPTYEEMLAREPMADWL